MKYSVYVEGTCVMSCRDLERAKKERDFWRYEPCEDVLKWGGFKYTTKYDAFILPHGKD